MHELTYVRMFVCMYKYERMYVYMYVCMYVQVCTYVYMYVCMYVRMYICMHVCMYACMYVRMSVCTYALLLFLGHKKCILYKYFFRNLLEGLYLPCYDLFSYHSQSEQNFPCDTFLGLLCLQFGMYPTWCLYLR